MKATATAFLALGVLACTALGQQPPQPTVSEGVVKPSWLEPKQAERIAGDTKPIKIKLRYPEKSSEVIEYSNGKWRYVISIAVNRGRSSVHHGLLLYDGTYVRGKARLERISTPFGTMQYMERGKRGYVYGWWPAEDTSQ